jgi:hypothetical protein
MRPVAVYFGARRALEKLAGVEIHWPAGRKAPPPDIPYCGFSGEEIHCIVNGSFLFKFYLIIIFLISQNRTKYHLNYT